MVGRNSVVSLLFPHAVPDPISPNHEDTRRLFKIAVTLKLYIKLQTSNCCIQQEHVEALLGQWLRARAAKPSLGRNFSLTANFPLLRRSRWSPGQKVDERLHDLDFDRISRRISFDTRLEIRPKSSS